MINRLILAIFASVLLTSQQIQSDELIPAEYFACYSNYNSMQMSPNGEYIAILSQPRDNKCDIEPDLQKRVEDDYRGGKLTLYSTENGSTTTLTSGKGNNKCVNYRCKDCLEKLATGFDLSQYEN